MNTLIEIFVNGTGISYTKAELDLINKILKDAETMKDVDCQDLFATIHQFEDVLCSNAIKGGILDKTSFEKTAKHFEMSVDEFKLQWGLFCLFLISQGVLKTDNNYGLFTLKLRSDVILMTTQDIIADKKELEETYNRCAELKCGKEGATKKCGACLKVKYCCVDCQKKDWKRHKSICKYL